MSLDISPPKQKRESLRDTAKKVFFSGHATKRGEGVAVFLRLLGLLA